MCTTLGPNESARYSDSRVVAEPHCGVFVHLTMKNRIEHELDGP